MVLDGTKVSIYEIEPREGCFLLPYSKAVIHKHCLQLQPCFFCVFFRFSEAT